MQQLIKFLTHINISRCKTQSQIIKYKNLNTVKIFYQPSPSKMSPSPPRILPSPPLLPLPKYPLE